MLKSVYIKNYALVDEGEIHFEPGLNIVTGETGAGKSILIGAIGALLGERTSAAILRPGEEKAVVEGHFNLQLVPHVQEFLRANELESPDTTLFVRREILGSGRSRAFINDTPVTLDTIETVAGMLVDLHGQHEHQSLLRTSEHLGFLDAFAGLAGQKSKVAACFAEAERCRAKLDALRDQEKTQHQRREFLAFQLEEIQKVDPQPGEDEELLAEEKRLAHSTELLESCGKIIEELYEGERSALELIGSAKNTLVDLASLDGFFHGLHNELETVSITLDEMAKSLQSYAARIEINPDRLEEVRIRLAAFVHLRKKYTATIEQIIEKKQNLAHEIAQIDSLDEEILAAERDWHQAIAQYKTSAFELSRARTEAIQRLQTQVPMILAEIGMPNTIFEVLISPEYVGASWMEYDGRPCRAFPTGIDTVEFYISSNPGQPTRPLAKIASGGEISRVMLALKSIIAHAVAVPVLIFDEIDIGISGRVAQAVGKKLQELAQSQQIVCITHLPQIASAGTTHFLVEKKQIDDTTVTRVRRLREDEREYAVAQLLSGEIITDSHLNSARELLKEAGAGFR